MKNVNQLVKQAQQMQAKITALQSELSERELEVSAGGGMVKIKINGKQEILDLKINPECIDLSDVALLDELVKTAVNQAITESNKMVSQAMNKVTGGVKIPGLF
jgi:DNA-binding YbaB/EbfC family protein